MMRTLALAALLAVSGCARQEPPSAPPATPPQSVPAAVAEPPPQSPPAAAPHSGQSETEQATASQESGDGDTEHQARSDVSLEKIAGPPPGAQLPAGKWQPGVNYDPVVPAQPTSVAPGKAEVLEVFWLACPHCYALEPYLRSWLKTKPAYVEFVRVPVMWQPIHRAHARLYYTLDALGRQDLVPKAFDTIHQDLENHIPPLFGDSEDQTLKLQEKFAVQNGISAEDFDRSYNSFTVNADLQRAEEVTQRYQVSGVPLVVVNGKYTTDVGKAGSEAKLIELINDLAAAEHAH
jgi:protein dithiol oxidoreductase (disulfide-forming)